MRRNKPETVTTKNVVNGHVPFSVDKWMSRHLEPTVVDLKGGKLVLGATEKSWARPEPLATSLVFEKSGTTLPTRLARMPVNYLMR